MSDRQAPTGEFMAPARVVYSVPVSFSQEFALDQAVNIAARVQSLVDSRAIFATKSVVENLHVSKMLEASKLKLTEQAAALRGAADRMTVYQIL
jgi:class 3 adenylate cyclase